MKNLKTKLTAIGLSTLMAVSATGAVTASAAEVTTTDTTKTIFFINNKCWDEVYDYTWDANGEDVAFPGEEMTAVGTTDVLGTSYSVYTATVNSDDSVIFSEGFDHGQQSNEIKLSNTSSNCFCLDSNNKIKVVTNFQTDKIDFVAKTSSRMAVNESNNRNCYVSDGNNILFINTSELVSSNVIVELTNLNGSTTVVNAIPQKNGNGEEMNGMYYIQVPQGNYIHADVIVKSCHYYTDITDTTDSVKISDGKAVACQRVFFNNDLSTKTWANQIVCAYAWNSDTGVAETANFSDAKRMTYYQNVCYGKINQYFYDVPLTCDSIIFLTENYGQGTVTAQTGDIALRYTTNTSSSIIMDGYAPPTSGSTNVSLFYEQVIVTASNV